MISKKLGISFIAIIISILVVACVYSVTNCESETFYISGHFESWLNYDETDYGYYVLTITNAKHRWKDIVTPLNHTEYWFSDIGDYDLDYYEGKDIEIEYISGCGNIVIKKIIKL